MRELRPGQEKSFTQGFTANKERSWIVKPGPHPQITLDPPPAVGSSQMCPWGKSYRDITLPPHTQHGALQTGSLHRCLTMGI